MLSKIKSLRRLTKNNDWQKMFQMFIYNIMYNILFFFIFFQILSFIRERYPVKMQINISCVFLHWFSSLTYS